MSDKIKFKLERFGEFQDFPLDNQLIILPDGCEYYLRWDKVRKGLVITQSFGSGMSIQPMVSNQIIIISNPEE